MLRRLVTVVAFLLGTAVVVGCGDSTMTSAPATEKQLQKEKMPGPAGGGGRPNSK